MPTKEQQARWNRTWYEKNKAKRQAINTAHRQMIAAFLLEYKRQRPCPCGEDHVGCLVLHHLRDKEGDRNEMVNWSMQRVMKELAKCVVLCANCHLKLHFDAPRQ